MLRRLLLLFVGSKDAVDKANQTRLMRDLAGKPKNRD